MDYELCLICGLDHLQRRYLNVAGSAWVEKRCTARGSNRTAAQSSVARTASRSHACTRVQALGKRAHVCLRPVSVYVCMLLFTGWMQTYGPSSVASNSCGAVCETVIVSGKLSQETLCSSGLKAVGVGVAWGAQSQCDVLSSNLMRAQMKPKVKLWVWVCYFPLLLLLLLNIWKGPNSHGPQSGLHGTGAPRPRLEQWLTLRSCLLCRVPPAPSRLITASGLAFFSPPRLKMDGYFLHVFSLVMDCFLTVLLLCIYLNVVPQLNTCSWEEIFKKKNKQDMCLNTVL